MEGAGNYVRFGNNSMDGRFWLVLAMYRNKPKVSLGSTAAYQLSLTQIFAVKAATGHKQTFISLTKNHFKRQK